MTPVLALFFVAAISPEQRAVDYLAREVPNWQLDNHCFSCHNNGDGARVLFAARRAGYEVPEAALAETSRWLVHPETWDNNPGAAGFSSPKLAHIQFASALVEGGFADPKVAIAAAESLLPFQDADGCWRVDTGGLPGAPATYGVALATYMARRTLEEADAKRFAAAIERANRWFEKAAAENTLDRAAMLLAMPQSPVVRTKWLDVVLRAQTSDGGWGPQLHTPAEDFDTAIVLLALEGLRGSSEEVGKALTRGREFLISRQFPTGGWLETTRPTGNQSYAEHISTTAWALYALLATDAKGH